MPNPREVASIRVNGDVDYQEWESVQVHLEWGQYFRTFRFSVSEQDPVAKGFSGLQIKPGDRCEVMLGGQLAVTGYVYERQTMYDAHRHGVLIAGQSRPGDSTRTAIDTKQNGGQYSGQSLRQIATQVFQQLGINVKFAGNSQALDSTIDDAQVQPTESHFHFVERLARGRAWIGDDVQGNLVLYGGLDGGGSGPALVEGENIQWARVTINDLSIIKEGEVYAQGPCTDKNWGASCTEPSVPFNMNFPRTKPYKLLLERGASNSKIMEELKYRARYEIAWRLGTQIRAEIGVYGWFAPNGGLWQPLPINEQTVNVYSPMAMLNTPLAIQALTFSQDNEAGTMTTLELVDPGHFYGNKEAWK